MGLAEKISQINQGLKGKDIRQQNGRMNVLPRGYDNKKHPRK